MRKIFSIIVIIFCIFSFNTYFQANETFVAPAFAEETLDSKQNINNQEEDVLEKPVFEPDKPQPATKKFTGKLSSLIIKIFGGVLLLLVIVICLSFIWFANLQRKREKNKKRMSANVNVINAVDNFARHRIKR